ncbi:hypothetical protein GE09DRAFT_1214035 [Coniochaeta sp. 2T2.1]|nr:hypothetical protein GE09DRAFT_1214035 [Coniochaeta sp. 2T2.1]
MEYLASEYLAKNEDEELRFFALTPANIYYGYSRRVIGFALHVQGEILTSEYAAVPLLRNPLPVSILQLYNAMEAVWIVLLALDEEVKTRRFPEAVRKGLLELYQKLFDPRNSPITARFIPLKRLTSSLTEAWESMRSDKDVALAFVDLNMVCVHHQHAATRREIELLFTLALVGSEVLIEEFLKGKDIECLLDVNLSITSERHRDYWTSDGDNGGALPTAFDDPEVFIFEQIDFHGPDYNAPGYVTTPLQIAVEQRAKWAVRRMLEASADPNSTGTVCGKALRRQSRRWSQASPLHIANMLATTDDDGYTQPESSANDPTERGTTISAILMEHGAKDFVQEENNEGTGNLPGFYDQCRSVKSFSVVDLLWQRIPDLRLLE